MSEINKGAIKSTVSRVLLTEAEAAARLGITKAAVKRLRLSRKLAYLKGRPVLVSEDDLTAYIAWKAAKDLNKASEAAMDKTLRWVRTMRLRRYFKLLEQNNIAKAE